MAVAGPDGGTTDDVLRFCTSPRSHSAACAALDMSFLDVAASSSVFFFLSTPTPAPTPAPTLAPTPPASLESLLFPSLALAAGADGRAALLESCSGGTGVFGQNSPCVPAGHHDRGQMSLRVRGGGKIRWGKRGKKKVGRRKVKSVRKRRKKEVGKTSNH